ncbi:MAG: nucleotidyltransferase domain-containing protein [archaeon]
MVNKINSILKQVLEKVEPSEKELNYIENSLSELIKLLKQRIKSLNLNVEIFVGGSFAKKTMIKKDNYDIDLFLRFSKKYKEDLSKLTEKIIQGIKDTSLIHGSRDYFKITKNSLLYFEIIPVLKITNPKQAENITDLSYSHVKYIHKKAKQKNLSKEIMLAKAFCYANHCYGAESYIKGFSGYSLELLIYHYGSFLKFIRAMSKVKKEKVVIDIEKDYKNKQVVLMDVNNSKLQSPIIIIDPTCKQRNALAALSNETFESFKKECINFLKNPSIKFFEIKKINLEEIKKNSKKNNNEFLLLEAKTKKQSGDIAGSKLLKFYNHLSQEINFFFEIKNKGFNYNNNQSARYFFVLKKKSEIIIQGPRINDKENIVEFKKKHKEVYEKKGRIYAKEKIIFDIKKFIKIWKEKNKKKIKEMYILGFVVVDD